jgi:hypothetical protein
MTYRYWVNTGRIITDPQDQLLVVKNGVAADETTSIVTFDFNPEMGLEGRTCRLIFDMWDRDHSTGTQQNDVFSVINFPSTSASLARVNIAAVRPAASRDQHRGRIFIPKPGSAQWIQSYNGYPDFPCPKEEVMAFEFVGAGDRVETRWDIGVTGPRVIVV